jgi:hypothetical protein
MVADEPGSMSPVSKLLPLSAVAVCAVLSRLVTVTRAPRSTVSDAGANLKSEIVIESEPLLCLGWEDPLGLAAAGLGSEPPQPAIGPATAVSATSEAMTWRSGTAFSNRSGRRG